MSNLSKGKTSWLSDIRYRMYFILLPFLAMMPGTGIAGGNSNPLNFSPPESDASVKLLGNIFGLVDGVLYGTGSQIVGEMFGMFNSAILVLGAIILMYTTIMSISNTANEGEYMGQKWSSIWIPIRSVVGVALLIPKASGYCAIQIFVMWVVIQGVGAADLIWNSALEYLQRGGVIVAQNISVGQVKSSRSTWVTTEYDEENDYDAITIHLDGAVDVETSQNMYDSAVYTNSGKVLKALICMHSLQYALELERQTFMNPSVGGVDPGLVPVFFTYIKVLDDNGQALDEIEFPPKVEGSNYSKYAGVCGKLRWTNFTVDDVGAKLESAGVPVIKVNGQYSANDSRIAASIKTRALAIGQLVNNLSSVAEMIVNNYKQEDLAKLPLGMWEPGGSAAYSAPSNAMWVGDRNFTKSPLLSGSELRMAVNAYFNIVMPTMRLLQGAMEDIDFIEDAKKDGWLLAGSYFFKLALLNQKMEGFDLNSESYTINEHSGNITAVLSPSATFSGDIAKEITISGANKKFQLSKDNLMATPLNGDSANPYSFNNSVEVYVSNALKVRTPPDAPTSDAEGAKPVPVELEEVQIPNEFDCGSPFILCPGILKFVAIAIANVILKAAMALSNAIIGAVLEPIHALGTFFLNTIKDAFKPGKNPVMELALLGKTLIDFAFDMVVMFLLSVILISLLLTPGLGLALVFIILLGPMVIAIATILIGYGTIFAFYIPLIPYMVFTFASVAWFIAVIEAMVAAPIVALGLAHPEGHDSFGKAREAIMLLANVFLRPALMIIGYVIAIILSFVTFHLVNAGFFRATNAITGTAFGIGSAIAPLFIVGLYTTIIMQVMQKSFDLIYLLPDRVLKWIGGQHTPGVSGEQMVGGGGADTSGGAVGGLKSHVDSASQMSSQGFEMAATQLTKNVENKLQRKWDKKRADKKKDKEDRSKVESGGEAEDGDDDNDDDSGTTAKGGKKGSGKDGGKSTPSVEVDTDVTGGTEGGGGELT